MIQQQQQQYHQDNPIVGLPQHHATRLHRGSSSHRPRSASSSPVRERRKFHVQIDSVFLTPARIPPTPCTRSRATELTSPHRNSLPSFSGRHPDVFSPRTRWLAPASAGRSRLSIPRSHLDNDSVPLASVAEEDILADQTNTISTPQSDEAVSGPLSLGDHRAHEESLPHLSDGFEGDSDNHGHDMRTTSHMPSPPPSPEGFRLTSTPRSQPRAYSQSGIRQPRNGKSRTRTLFQNPSEDTGEPTPFSDSSDDEDQEDIETTNRNHGSKVEVLMDEVDDDEDDQGPLDMSMELNDPNLVIIDSSDSSLDMDTSLQAVGEISGIDMSFASDITMEMSGCSFIGDAFIDGDSSIMSMISTDDLNISRALLDIGDISTSSTLATSFEAPAPLSVSAADINPMDNVQQHHSQPQSIPMSMHKQHMLKTFKDLAERSVLIARHLAVWKDKVTHPNLAHLTGSAVWASIYACPSPKVVFHGVSCLTLLASPHSGAQLSLEEYSGPEISSSLSTANVLLSPDRFMARNEMWTFESCVANVSTHSHGLYYYEVIIMSKGVIQVGWATEDCKLVPEKGYGVGDDYESISFDGHRCRAWHGKTNNRNTDNDYGVAWSPGDVIGCFLDTAQGTASFLLNGKDLGIAFVGLEVNSRWHPAVSLSTGQQVLFNFGREGFWYAPPKKIDLLTIPEHIATPKAVTPHAAPNRTDGVLFKLDSSEPCPMIYYEASNLKAKEVIGYCNGAVQGKEGVKMPTYIAILQENGQLQIGSMLVGHNITQNTVIGCGVTVAHVAATHDKDAHMAPVVFFTIDGVSLGVGIRLGPGKHRIFPFLCASRPSPNFGQLRFQFVEADSRQRRVALSQKLLQWGSEAQKQSSI
eukprot:m.59139 g.59139  ORF g.59139 m.59139 type:complete len:866 (-) comp11222_c0_seq6:86-2683(-)